MTDIVERLRAPRPDAHPSAGAADMAEIDNQRREAADEIERMRAALRRIADLDLIKRDGELRIRSVQSIAREALGDD